MTAQEDHVIETTAIVRHDEDAFAPAFTIDRAVRMFHDVGEFVSKIMRPDTDFGVIPGAGDKRVLLKPGAEKLATFFGLRKIPELIAEVKDWTGADHDGEPFFEFSYRYHLYRGDVLIASADGSANSWEKKYRWRNQDRLCPDCGVAAIKRSKFPPRDDPGRQPGWYCFGKIGGCGAQFDADDPTIVKQIAGRIPNPDIHDQVNTLQKMAQKRALVAAVLLAVNASEFFTQDIEEHEPDLPEAPKANVQVKPDPTQAARAALERAKDEAKKRGLTADDWNELKGMYPPIPQMTIAQLNMLRTEVEGYGHHDHNPDVEYVPAGNQDEIPF